MQRIMKTLSILCSFFIGSNTFLAASNIRSRAKSPLHSKLLPQNAYDSSDDSFHEDIELGKKHSVPELLAIIAQLTSERDEARSKAQEAKSALTKLAIRLAEEREPEDRLDRVVTSLKQGKNPETVAAYIEAAARIKKRRLCTWCCCSL